MYFLCKAPRNNDVDEAVIVNFLKYFCCGLKELLTTERNRCLLICLFVSELRVNPPENRVIER